MMMNILNLKASGPAILFQHMDMKYGHLVTHTHDIAYRCFVIMFYTTFVKRWHIYRSRSCDVLVLCISSGQIFFYFFFLDFSFPLFMIVCIDASSSSSSWSAIQLKIFANHNSFMTIIHYFISFIKWPMINS